MIASIFPNKGANKSTLPKNLFIQSFEPVLKCKQVDNYNFKIFLKDQNSQRKKKQLFLEF